MPFNNSTILGKRKWTEVEEISTREKEFHMEITDPTATVDESLQVMLKPTSFVEAEERKSRPELLATIPEFRKRDSDSSESDDGYGNDWETRIDPSDLHPSREEWSAKDKKSFEIMYKRYGKWFYYYKALLPHKTTAETVDYYYWSKKKVERKKSRKPEPVLFTCQTRNRNAGSYPNSPPESEEPGNSSSSSSSGIGSRSSSFDIY